jgi:hypothetical protein
VDALTNPATLLREQLPLAVTPVATALALALTHALFRRRELRIPASTSSSSATFSVTYRAADFLVEVKHLEGS